MEILKLSSLNDHFLTVNVTDYMAKKRYFDDCEITGWLIVQKKDQPAVYHLYQRGYDKITHEVFDEQVFFINEEISGVELEKEIYSILYEATLQRSTGENTKLINEVRNALFYYNNK